MRPVLHRSTKRSFVRRTPRSPTLSSRFRFLDKLSKSTSHRPLIFGERRIITARRPRVRARIKLSAAKEVCDEYDGLSQHFHSAKVNLKFVDDNPTLGGNAIMVAAVVSIVSI